MTSGFTWRDGERTIRFGRGAIAEAVETLGGEGYALLTTERAAAMAPGVVEGAAGVHMLGAAASTSWPATCSARSRASGSWRSAAAAWSTPPRRWRRPAGGTQVAMAVPTTLSGAEMTRIHRRAAGADQRAPTVRAAGGGQRPRRCPPRSRSPSWPPARSTRSATRSRGRARRSPTRWRRSPPTTARGCSRARWRAARPRGARARRAAGRLRDRLDRLRPAPRALPDARAARRRRRTARPTRCCSATRSARSRGASRQRLEALGDGAGAAIRRTSRRACAG